MTGLLASVCSPEEAEQVMRGGADLIDLKDPSTGALGALPEATIRACVRRVAGQRLVSATIGDVVADSPEALDAVANTVATGVDLVKVGLFEPGPWRRCLQALQPHADRIVVVLFCDQDRQFQLLPHLAESGFAGAMIDTANKDSGGLTAHMNTRELVMFVQRCRQLDLLCGLAGSLRPQDIPELLSIAPDYLGFRTALCLHAQRQDRIDPAAIRRIRAMMPATHISSHARRRTGESRYPGPFEIHSQIGSETEQDNL